VSAARALDLRYEDPAAARQLAIAVARRAARAGDSVARSTAWRAAALCSLDLGDAAGAARRVALAVREARLTGDPDILAAALVSASGVRALSGDHRRAISALDEAERACVDPTSAVASDVIYQRAWVRSLAGDHDLARRDAKGLVAMTAARTGVAAAEARALHGLVLQNAGRDREAIPELVAACEGFRAAGASYDVVRTMLNLATSQAAVGAWSDAFATLDEAEARAPDGMARAWALAMRARVTSRANLLDEAQHAADGALAAAGGADAVTRAAFAFMALDVAARRRDAERVEREAGTVRAMYRRAGLPARALVCELIGATTGSSARRRRSVARLGVIAAELERAGLTSHAVDAYVAAVDATCRAGRPEQAAAHVERLRALRTRVPGVERSRTWLAEAAWHAASGHERKASRAVLAGQRALAEVRDALGCAELRVGASALGAELGELGVRLALRARDPWRVLAAVEAQRALGSLRQHTVAADVGELLDRLRAATQRLRDDPESAGPAVRRQVVELEREVRRRSRHVVGSAAMPAAPWRELLAAFDGVGVVVFVAGGDVHTVTVRGGPSPSVSRPTAAVPVIEVADLAGQLGFALRRLARSRPGSAGAVSARTLCDQSIDRLRTLLVPSASFEPGERVIVMPPASLAALPWSEIVGPKAIVSVSPSLRLAGPSAMSAGRAVAARLVAASGPGLPGARVEVGAVRQIYEPQVCEPASVADLLDSLAGASVAHLACHGHFRSDNPLFSWLDLDVGPLTAYDLERLEQAPQTVVLSACDSGGGRASAGDELLGFTSTLFARGTRAVVASVVAVPDAETVAVMTDLHRRLAAGCGVAAATSAARSAVDRDDPAGYVASVGFQTYGA
jgi:hypothetical protein